MKPILCIAFAVAVLLANTVHAEVYRCVQPDGSVKYADEPCAKGERGGQIDVQPMTIDAADGRQRTQKFLSDLKAQPAYQNDAANVTLPGTSGASTSQAARRMQRWERCEPLLDESSGVRRQAIGQLCGADMDEALFDTCLNKVQEAQGVSETDAVVRACTGTGLQSGAVLVQPSRPRYIPVPVPCSQRPHDPACASQQPRSSPGVKDTFKAPASAFGGKAAPAPSESVRGGQDKGLNTRPDDLGRR